MPFTLIDTTKRSILSEGRSQGFGTAFAKPTVDGETITLTTTMPLSACKDYLGDALYSEHTGKPYTIHGLTTTKHGLFETGRAYLIIGILPQGAKNPKVYPEMKADIEALESNHLHIQGMVNWFEAALKLPDTERTVVTKVGANRFVMALPVWWTAATYRISLLVLLARCSLRYVGAPDPMTYLAAVDCGSDRYHLTTALGKAKRMMGGEIPVQDWTTVSTPHHLGIVSYPFESLVAAKLAPIVAMAAIPTKPLIHITEALAAKGLAKTEHMTPVGA